MNLSDINKKIILSKREYGAHEFKEEEIHADPFQQFLFWFNAVLELKTDDPCAAVLATVDANNIPDARVVLLNELQINQFIFYTHYESRKGKQLALHVEAALNFYWPSCSRQVRLRGSVKKIPAEQSDAYFARRSRESQLAVYAWHQDEILASRAEMQKRLQQVAERFKDQKIPRPDYWGGYQFTPFEYEFFQGRDWRMHDRILYRLHHEQWLIERLAP
ncbi:hypothetical protein AYO45_05100 [Gammaproteobacteria bacterium SCGC AG-212-F23]|nr:hypothetical protein AYO45_05100 [Gammaproteobacteria bacterium SCGC AG-212-F23]